ncbi:MAG: hypothetical protein HND27_10820 [Bacteroidetes bacterium]|nr:hypothetical protein [Bacteroidota bacterium]
MRKTVNTGNKFSAFGSTQPNPNNLNANQYRYGFGGMEQDKQSSSYTTYFRQYDPRIARWKSTDPVIQPWQSPYTAFDNNPILYVDPMGDVSWCGIGTVFSGLASFAGNMALRALPTLGLNIALNNFLPNATHTGNNSGRFLGADGNGRKDDLPTRKRLYGHIDKIFVSNENNWTQINSNKTIRFIHNLNGKIVKDMIVAEGDPESATVTITKTEYFTGGFANNISYTKKIEYVESISFPYLFEQFSFSNAFDGSEFSKNNSNGIDILNNFLRSYNPSENKKINLVVTINTTDISFDLARQRGQFINNLLKERGFNGSTQIMLKKFSVDEFIPAFKLEATEK